MKNLELRRFYTHVRPSKYTQFKFPSYRVMLASFASGVLPLNTAWLRRRHHSKYNGRVCPECAGSLCVFSCECWGLTFERTACCKCHTGMVSLPYAYACEPSHCPRDRQRGKQMPLTKLFLSPPPRKFPITPRIVDPLQELWKQLIFSEIVSKDISWKTFGLDSYIV